MEQVENIDQSKFKRFPALEKKISDINPEKDIRVRILGTVIDKDEGVCVIDDGSGKAEIFGDFNCEIGDTLRVFARVLALEDGFELRSEIVQNMNSLNKELYRKVQGL